jgi:hypothetical protein
MIQSRLRKANNQSNLCEIAQKMIKGGKKANAETFLIGLSEYNE